jgi:hypothetical protein
MADVEWTDEGWEGLVVELMAESVQAAKNAVFDAGNHMREAVIEKLAGARTGRVYRVPGTDGATYQASAPGEPPAVRLNELRRNINVSDVKVEGDEVSVAVGVDEEAVKYARRLELGGYSKTKNGGSVYIAPRPYLRPTFFEQESTVINILERAVGGR